MLKYFFFKTVQIVVTFLPLRFVYRAAVALSDLKYFFSRIDKQAVMDNIGVICPQGVDAKALSKEVFRNFGKYLVDFFRMPSFTKAFVEKNVVIKNQERLDEALRLGKGVIIMTAHIGNWELGGLAFGRLGYPLTAVALPHKEKSVNELFNRQRADGGVTVVPVSNAIRPCLKTLRENGIVALLADRDFSATGEPMMFFGRETMIPRGIAMFAYRTGATVLPMFLTRTGDMSFEICIDEPLLYPANFGHMDEEDFIRQFLGQQVAVLEKHIRKNPAQWLMFRRFWIDEATGPERITST